MKKTYFGICLVMWGVILTAVAMSVRIALVGHSPYRWIAVAIFAGLAIFMFGYDHWLHAPRGRRESLH